MENFGVRADRLDKDNIDKFTLALASLDNLGSAIVGCVCRIKYGHISFPPEPIQQLVQQRERQLLTDRLGVAVVCVEKVCRLLLALGSHTTLIADIKGLGRVPEPVGIQANLFGNVRLNAQ